MCQGLYSPWERKGRKERRKRTCCPKSHSTNTFHLSCLKGDRLPRTETVWRKEQLKEQAQLKCSMVLKAIWFRWSGHETNDIYNISMWGGRTTWTPSWGELLFCSPCSYYGRTRKGTLGTSGLVLHFVLKELRILGPKVLWPPLLRSISILKTGGEKTIFTRRYEGSPFPEYFKISCWSLLTEGTLWDPEQTQKLSLTAYLLGKCCNCWTMRCRGALMTGEDHGPFLILMFWYMLWAYMKNLF